MPFVNDPASQVQQLNCPQITSKFLTGRGKVREMSSGLKKINDTEKADCQSEISNYREIERENLGKTLSYILPDD